MMAAASVVPPTQEGVDLLTVADEASLTPNIIDTLSNRLGQDWKRFARGTEQFSDAQIENIDADEQRVYEKCYKMLKQWEQRSSAKLTVAMVKLNLIAIGRNDLLLDVFNSVPPGSQRSMASAGAPSASLGSRGSGTSSGGTAGANAFAEPTVSELQYKHIKKLCNLLDPDHGVGIKNWQDLGYAIFQGDKDVSDRIESLHLSYSGGGSPAAAFLKRLGMSRPSLTVTQFIEIAKKLQRRDISNYLESMNCTPEVQLRKINFQHLDKVARDLDKNIRGISDWRTFADTVGYSNDEIAEFKLAMKETNVYSPTQSLLDLMRARYPLLKLKNIKIASSCIGRNDVAQYLGSVIEEITLARNT